MTISEREKQLVYLELERSQFNISSALAVFNKATMMYFIVLVLALFAMANNYASKDMLNVLIVMSMAILIVGAIPYFRSTVQEEKNINRLVERVKSKK